MIAGSQVASSQEDEGAGGEEEEERAVCLMQVLSSLRWDFAEPTREKGAGEKQVRAGQRRGKRERKKETEHDCLPACPCVAPPASSPARLSECRGVVLKELGDD